MKKTSLVIALLMVMGIFATGFGLAAENVNVDISVADGSSIQRIQSVNAYSIKQGGAVSSVEAGSVSPIGISGNELTVDIESSIDEIEDIVGEDGKRIGFWKMTNFIGYSVNGKSNELNMIRGIWVSGKFISESENERFKSAGAIKIDGEKYRLTMIEQDSDRIKFFIVKNQNRDAISGELTVEVDKAYKNGKTWIGKLQIGERVDEVRLTSWTESVRKSSDNEKRLRGASKVTGETNMPYPEDGTSNLDGDTSSRIGGGEKVSIFRKIFGNFFARKV